MLLQTETMHDFRKDIISIWNWRGSREVALDTVKDIDWHSFQSISVHSEESEVTLSLLTITGLLKATKQSFVGQG